MEKSRIQVTWESVTAERQKIDVKDADRGLLDSDDLLGRPHAEAQTSPLPCTEGDLTDVYLP